MPLTHSTTAWIDQQLADDPVFAQEVEAELEAMRVEQALIALRESRGLSQRQLAHRIGVKQPVIARIESGRATNIGLRTLIRLVRALDGRIHLDIKPAPARAQLHVAAQHGARKIAARKSNSRR